MHNLFAIQVHSQVWNLLYILSMWTSTGYNWHECFITLAQFCPSWIVIACVCVPVSACINDEFVRAVSWDPFSLWSSDVDQRCETAWLRSLLLLALIDLKLKGKISCKYQSNPMLSLLAFLCFNNHLERFPSLRVCVQSCAWLEQDYTRGNNLMPW